MTDDEKIAAIIHSLKTYGLGDIKHNKSRTIAAFILGISFIDQMAAFTYRKGTTLNKRCEKFLKTYVPVYAGLNLYRHFRNFVLHNYSSKGRYAVTNDKTFKKPFDKINGVVVINTTILIKEITNGFQKFEKTLRRKGSSARKNAIRKFKDFPILMHKTV
jgi:hypothetical protein